MIYSIAIELKCDAPGCDARLTLCGWDISCVDEATVNELAVENKWIYDGDDHHFCSESCRKDYEKEQEYHEPGIYTYSKRIYHGKEIDQ